MKTNFLGVVQSNESISTLVVVVKCLRQFSNLCSFKYCVEKSICTVRDEFCISELKFKGLYCQQCSFIDGVCTCIEGECLSFLEVNGLHVMLRKSVRSHCSSLYTHIGLTHCSVGCYFTQGQGLTGSDWDFPDVCDNSISEVRLKVEEAFEPIADLIQLRFVQSS